MHVIFAIMPDLAFYRLYIHSIHSIHSNDLAPKFRFALYMFQVAISIAKIVVGILYLKQCDLDIPLYLLLSGSIELALSLLKMQRVIWHPNSKSDPLRLETLINRIHACVGFGFGIWGSILVFGNYSEISYRENVKPFCSEAAVIFAFVILIIHWIMKTVLLCWLCVFVSMVFCVWLMEGDDWTNCEDWNTFQV